IYYNLEKDDHNNPQYFFFNCTKLYFRLPGEHVIDQMKYDMELQFNCSGLIPGDTQNYKYAFVAVPVQVVKNYLDQSPFFNSFNSLLNEGLGAEVTINDFSDALDMFNMHKGVFFYVAGANYPQCLVSNNWIVV